MDEENEDKGSMLEQQQEALEQQLAELEQQEQADQQEKLRIEEKLTKNKLKFICMNLAVGSRTMLKETEKATMKKAKQFPNLKNDIQQVNLLLAVNRGKVAMKTISASPVLYYVFIGAMILFLIICVVAFVGSIMPWLFPEDDTGGTGGASSPFGITGEDFYGGRMVYKDDEQATISIIEDYVELVESGIEETKTIAIENVTLEINIALPSEDYNYSTFEETAFQGAYPVLYSTIFDVAKAVYKVDNATDYSGANLVECVNGILYFGYGATVMADVSEIVTDAIINNTTYTANEGTTINKTTDIDPQIENKLSTLYAQEKYNLRAEKLFVKDYILNGEETIQDISKENYVAFVFMPKNNVTFTKFSFSVGNADLSEFSINMNNNGSEITLKKDDFDFSVDEDSTTQNYIYVSNENLNVNANVFTDIDTNNLNALSSGLSLFDVVENVVNYSTYLENTTSENSVEYLTIKKNGVVVNLSNKEAFNFSEFESIWE